MHANLRLSFLCIKLTLDPVAYIIKCQIKIELKDCSSFEDEG